MRKLAALTVLALAAPSAAQDPIAQMTDISAKSDETARNYAAYWAPKVAQAKTNSVGMQTIFNSFLQGAKSMPVSLTPCTTDETRDGEDAVLKSKMQSVIDTFLTASKADQVVFDNNKASWTDLSKNARSGLTYAQADDLLGLAKLAKSADTRMTLYDDVAQAINEDRDTLDLMIDANCVVKQIVAGDKDQDQATTLSAGWVSTRDAARGMITRHIDDYLQANAQIAAFHL